MDPPPESNGVASGRLRLMCSFGGHIVPRPHAKSLCYVGGETRIFVADRDTSLSDLSDKISKSLLGGRTFCLKYQLPNEDLDSLISVTTDEDLENMVDEFDRAASCPKPTRLRVFLFPTKSQSPIESIPESESESWFLRALNGVGLGDRDRGFSDSVNCLLGLDDEPVVARPDPCQARLGKGSGQKVVENENEDSSFGSNSSNRVVSDDDRSERLVQLQEQKQQRASGGFDSPSPDSVLSDSSVVNALSRLVNANANAIPVDQNARVLVQDPGFVLQHQFDPPQQQQQFIRYVQQHPGALPVPAYYNVYPSQPQQIHPQLDQQYPVYYTPRPAQPYNIVEPPAPPSPAKAQQPPPLAYAATRSPLKPAVVKAPPSQHQQQFVGFSQMQYSPVAPTTSSPAGYDGYEYPETDHPSIYHTQPLAPTMSPAQYQTTTTGANAAAVSLLPDGSNDAIKQQQQQVRTSQPV